MPVTKQAKKKLRKDKKRTERNLVISHKYKKAVKKAKKTPTSKNVIEATRLIDKASKKHLIHSNKAARLKSKITKSSASKKSTKKTPTSKNKAK